MRTEYNPNQNPRVIIIQKLYGNYLNNKKHGLWRVYNDNGQLEQEVNWKHDIQDGITKFYNNNGQLEIEENIKNGKRNGILKWFHKNGKVYREGNFKNNKEDGVFKYYDENGKLEKEIIKGAFETADEALSYAVKKQSINFRVN